MELTLSSNLPLNTTLFNDDGQALYISRTPSKWHHQTTVISRVQPDTDRKFDYGNDDGEEFDEDADNELGLTELARIHWKHIGSSTLEYKGMQVATSDYLHSENILGLKRTFTASDGCSYGWTLGPTTFSTLVLQSNDESKTPIAHFHRSNMGIIGKKHKAFLRIFPEGMHIIDDIVVTFIYLDKVRRTLQKYSN